MHFAYSLIFSLLAPFLWIRLYWKGIKAPAYRLRWQERFGFYSNPHNQDVIWFHAVSVGEAEALFPLIDSILNRHPSAKMLVTTTTPTGSARVKAVLNNRVDHVYLPYDIPYCVGRFMRHFKPKLAVIVETEIWPNLFSGCKQRNIPLFLINARLSEKSLRNYQKIGRFIQSVLSQITLIVCQTPEDADRFLVLGAAGEQVVNSGNIKFDRTLSQENQAKGNILKQELFSKFTIWLAASTHKGEEESLIKVFLNLKPLFPKLLLAIAPRHPERFAEVKNLCEKNNLKVTTRSSQLACEADTEIFLIDTMGELGVFYLVADVAFVGGSLVPIGGHNVLEAVTAGTPVIFGPYMANFRRIAQGLLERNAAIQCQDPAHIQSSVRLLLESPDENKRFTDNAKIFMEANRGALERIYQILKPSLD
ncbi:MAG: 3-deoxy-D-manno-octulosonic acid transferase [Methylobacter sp.]|nr:MAG: 3-deoxy-D-manno-octulosonic acid transferase [Methylobacter sp.]PPD22985.1 MAG: 3-deoxy-D-manno-octulosonic acid transferase [Methylobacter sp.]PPD37427.1 MAG: 3-deoxy-D-manno-octulosonic acid transferase [Methylomonas sp.]